MYAVIDFQALHEWDAEFLLILLSFCSVIAEFVLIGRLVSSLCLIVVMAGLAGCAHAQRCARRQCSKLWRQCKTGRSPRCPCLRRERPSWPRAQTESAMTLVGTFPLSTWWWHMDCRTLTLCFGQAARIIIISFFLTRSSVYLDCDFCDGKPLINRFIIRKQFFILLK